MNLNPLFVDWDNEFYQGIVTRVGDTMDYCLWADTHLILMDSLCRSLNEGTLGPMKGELDESI